MRYIIRLARMCVRQTPHTANSIYSILNCVCKHIGIVSLKFLHERKKNEMRKLWFDIFAFYLFVYLFLSCCLMIESLWICQTLRWTEWVGKKRKDKTTRTRFTWSSFVSYNLSEKCREIIIYRRHRILMNRAMCVLQFEQVRLHSLLNDP